MDEPTLHPDVAPLAFLLGTWTGQGQGEYPTIEPFTWADTTRFFHVGKPVLLYEQRTKDTKTGEPRHAESGFIRIGSAVDTVELVVAHSTGHVELADGVVDGERVEFTSALVRGTGTAKDVDLVHRVYLLDGSTLRVTLAMAAVGEPSTHHLRSELTRQS